MASNPSSLILTLISLLLLLISSLPAINSDISSDRTECASKLVSLSTCLPYVQGASKAPTPDCCTNLKQVLQSSPKCLCLLIKDRNDPDLGFKINATLALGLPTVCQNPVNISKCPELLGIPADSPDAAIFEGNNTNTTTTTPASGPSSSTTGISPTPGSARSNHLSLESKFFLVELGVGFCLSIILPLLLSS